MKFRNEKMREIIIQLAGRFLTEISNGTSLITVTEVKIADTLSTADIFVSVFPDSKEVEALDFLKRNRRDFKQFVMDNVKFPKIPFFDFLIDKGEKHRQRIEEISSSL